MDSVLFYDDNVKVEAPIQIRVGGAAVPHEVPPSLSVHQGSVTFDSIATVLKWAVDPERTLMNLLFLSLGETQGDEDANRLFPFRKFVVEFPSQVVTCGISTATSSFSQTNSQQVPQFTLVWVSTDMSIKVKSFTVARESGGRIIVEPVGDVRTTGSLQMSQHISSGTVQLPVQGCVISQLGPHSRGLKAVVLLSNGHSVWSVSVTEGGVAQEQLLLSGENTSNALLNDSQTGWSLLRRLVGTESEAMSVMPQHGARLSFLGIAAIPRSESFLVVNWKGSVAKFETYRNITQQQVLFSYPSYAAPTSVVALNTSLLQSPLGQNEFFLDIFTSGRNANSNDESVWWHRSALTLVGGPAVEAASFSDAKLVVQSQAPSRSAYLQSACSSANSATFLWRNVQFRRAPLSAMSLIASSASMEDEAQQRRQAAAVCPSCTAIQLIRLDVDSITISSNTIAASMAEQGGDQVASIGDDISHKAMLLRHCSGKTSAYILSHRDITVSVPGSDAIKLLLHRIFTETRFLLPPRSLIPFASLTFCPVTSPHELGDAEMTMGTVPFLEGLEVVSSHEEGPQSFLNLVSDVINNVATSTTLGGYHELAAVSHIFRHPPSIQVTADMLREAVAKVLRVDQGFIEALGGPAINVRSRLFLQQQIGTELLERIVFLVASYVAWITHSGHGAEEHLAVQKEVRGTIELLCAAINCVAAVGPLVCALSDSEDITASVLRLLLNANSMDPTLHAVTTAARLWRLGGQYGWNATAAWCHALRQQHPLLQHFAVLRLIDSGRTTSGAEVACLCANVACELGLNSPPVISELLKGGLLEGFGPFDVDAVVAIFGDKLTAQHLCCLYRAGVLRSVTPKALSTSTAVSGICTANSFLPDLLSLKLALLQVTSTDTLLPPINRSLAALVSDVYLAMARASLDDFDFGGCCRLLSLALAESPDAASEPQGVESAVHKILVSVVERAFTENAANTLVELPLGNATLLSLLTTALVQYIPKSADRGDKDRLVFDTSVLVFRFLVRRRAYGQAGRVVLDAAATIRKTGAGTIVSLSLVEQLTALSLSAAELITDMPSPFETTAPIMHSPSFQSSRGFPGTSPLAEEPLSFPSVSMQQSSRGGFGGTTNATRTRPHLSRDDIPIGSRKFQESCAEHKLLVNNFLVDLTKPMYDDDVTTDAAATYAKRLLRSLVSARMWEEAAMYAEVTDQPLVPVLQSQAVDLLDDPRHVSLMTASSGSSSPLSSTRPPFIQIVAEWTSLINECVHRSTAETNFNTMSCVLHAMLHKNYKLIPSEVKTSLRRLKPNALVALLLNTKVLVKGSDEKKVPSSLAEEALQVTIEVLEGHRARKLTGSRMLITAGVLDKACEAAKEAVRNTAHSTSLHRTAQELLRLVSSLQSS